MAHPLRHAPPQIVLFALASAALALPHLAHAELSGHVDHQVQAGDTLMQLATQYYGTPKLWPQLQKYNRVANPKHLKPGSTLLIPINFLPEEAAEVSYVQGSASATNGKDKEQSASTPLQPGQKLREGTRIHVAPDSFVTIKLADGSLIRIQAQSDVQLQQLRRKGRSGSLQSVLEMQQGSLNSTVGTEPDPTRKFEVRTPRATTSVRGTSFDVALTENGTALASVTHGTVAVQSRDANAAQGTSKHAPPAAPAALLNQGQGIAVSSDGQVGTAQTLLASPDLSGVPATLEDANFLNFPLGTVPNADAYQVQVARDESMSEVLRSGSFKTAMVRMKIIDDGDYYVTARAVDSHDLPGMPAKRKIKVKTQPTPPLYQQPAPGATTSRTSGELKCTRVSGVQSYRIQVASDAAGTSGFAKPLMDEIRSGDCSAALATLATGNYLWRAASIRTLSDGQPDQGPFSVPQAFKVADNPAAMDMSALNSSEDTPGIHLQWPGEPDQTYRLQVARTEDFANLLADEKLDKPRWNASDIKPGEYFVRIQTRDTATGLESPFSAARQIRAAAAVQSAFGLPLTTSDGEPLSRP